MNNNRTAVFDLMREIYNAAGIKTKRAKVDFFADRIVQACSEKTIARAMEKLTKTVGADLGNIKGKTIMPFLQAAKTVEGGGIYKWIKDNPSLSALIVSLPVSEYRETLKEVEIQGERNASGVALPAPKYDIPIHIKCLSPLQHGGDVKAGNVTLFRRMDLLTQTGGCITLPFYAGNAIRGQVRDILADDFLHRIGVAKNSDKLALWFFYALYSGGILGNGDKGVGLLNKRIGRPGTVNTDGISKLRKMIPMISLLGAALGNRIIPGMAMFADYRPECVEWGNGTNKIDSLFEWQFMTRREDNENSIENNSMIVNAECLKTGVVLHGGVDIEPHCSEIEIGALVHGLDGLAQYGYIGAENRRGFGRVDITCEGIKKYAKRRAEYKKYIEIKKKEIYDYCVGIGAIHACN